MDACRQEIGRTAAEIIVAQLEKPETEIEKVISLTPTIAYGDTLRRR
jgi:LacI family gluconate utilization system Gnt-I transcriptional repressor